MQHGANDASYVPFIIPPCASPSSDYRSEGLDCSEGCFRWEYRPDYADPRLEFDRVRLHLLLDGLDAMAVELPSPVTASNIL